MPSKRFLVLLQTATHDFPETSAEILRVGESALVRYLGDTRIGHTLDKHRGILYAQRLYIVIRRVAEILLAFYVQQGIAHVHVPCEITYRQVGVCHIIHNELFCLVGKRHLVWLTLYVLLYLGLGVDKFRDPVFKIVELCIRLLPVLIHLAFSRMMYL